MGRWWLRLLLLMTNTRGLEGIYDLLGDLSNQSRIYLACCIRALEGVVDSIIDRWCLVIDTAGPDSIRVAPWPGTAVRVRIKFLEVVVSAQFKAVGSRLYRRAVALSRCHARVASVTRSSLSTWCRCSVKLSTSRDSRSCEFAC